MTEFVLISLSVMLAATVQTATGIGFAMVAVPLLVQIDIGLVPGAAILGSLILPVIMTLDGRQHIVAAELRRLVPGLALGTAAGAVAIALMPPDAAGLIFAVIILAAVAITASGMRVALSPPALFGGGFAAGLMGTASGIHGPPLAVLYLREHPEKTRATIAVIFAIGYTMSLIALAIAGLFGAAELRAGIAMIPGVLAGYAAGRALRGALPVGLVRAAMLILAGASGLLLMVRSL